MQKYCFPCPQGQGHSEGSWIQSKYGCFSFCCIFSTIDRSCHKYQFCCVFCCDKIMLVATKCVFVVTKAWLSWHNFCRLFVVTKHVFVVTKIILVAAPTNDTSELHSLLQPNLVWWYIIISQIVLWKDWIAMFKVKVTAEVQNFLEFLSVLYLGSFTNFITTRLGVLMYHY